MIAPDYNEAAKFSDMWLHPKQGTDAALALALGHVVLREFYVDRQAEYFADYTRKYSDFPLLVKLVERTERWFPIACCARPTSRARLVKRPIPIGKPSPLTKLSGKLVAPAGSAGFRWDTERQMEP